MVASIIFSHTNHFLSAARAFCTTVRRCAAAIAHESEDKNGKKTNVNIGSPIKNRTRANERNYMKHLDSMAHRPFARRRRSTLRNVANLLCFGFVYVCCCCCCCCCCFVLFVSYVLSVCFTKNVCIMKSLKCA